MPAARHDDDDDDDDDDDATSKLGTSSFYHGYLAILADQEQLTSEFDLHKLPYICALVPNIRWATYRGISLFVNSSSRSISTGCKFDHC